MIFHPGILALLLSSALTSAMLCYAAFQGIRILRYWDIRSGSERQLALERRTYLVSTVMGYALGFQLFSLFLFIYTADALSSLFIGAMCAAGSLKVNALGYPTLLLKIVCCVLAGLWLILNATDNRAYDYPLIRVKYAALLLLAPLVLTETILQAGYLLRLRPNIITSCCSIIFSADTKTIMSGLFTLPHVPALLIFFSSAAITMTSGSYLYLRAKGAFLYASASFIHGTISIVGLISFISIYIYELPTHHCPFCILHQEYGYVGYFFYSAILVSTIFGMGAGVINLFRTKPSLQNIIPHLQKRCALISLIATLACTMVVGWNIIFSNLTLQSY